MGAKDDKKIFIRDVLYKTIDISEAIIRELIATKEFQRLRWISQLGGTQIAFPNATHTRYTHSLGVFHVITKILNTVSGSEKLDHSEKLIVRIAGLLHDLGHGPFSHTFEKIVNFKNEHNYYWNHEYYTCQIIQDPTTEVNQVLRKHNIDVAAIVAIISKNEIGSVLYQRQLVSSQIDCDRIDYLMRDAYFTGVDYGAIDFEWVISNMIIDENKGIIFHVKALWAIENYLITRFHMYTQVYYHKSSVIFDLKLVSFFRYLKQLYEQNYQWKVNIELWKTILTAQLIPTSVYLQLTDATLINFLRDIITFETDRKLLAMANSIFYAKNDYQVILHQQTAKVSKNKSTILLKNTIYDATKEVIMIKVNDGKVVRFDEVSQIFKKSISEQVINFELIKKTGDIIF